MLLIKFALFIGSIVALFSSVNAAIRVPVTHDPSLAMMLFGVAIFASIMAAALPSDLVRIEY